MPTIHQVVITGQKKTQDPVDDSTSIINLDKDKLEKNNIGNAQSLSDYMPGFNMAQTGLGTFVSIRGISSEINLGFEQAAPLFVDGIRYGRAKLARAPFLDIEHIDMLRGPQSLLLGKNTTAGALSIITAKPTDTFEGHLNILYEPEYGEKDIRLILSGPINETISGRMAILKRTDNGFIENTTLNRTEPENDERVIRTTLEWKPNQAWDIRLKLEDGNFNTLGRNIEAIQPVSYNPNNPNPYATVLSYLTAGSYHLDLTQDGFRQSNGDFSYNKTNNITLTAEHDTDLVKLTFKTGYNTYKSDELCDCDFTGISFINIYSAEKYQERSQEILIASQEQQTLEWIIGGLYIGNELNSHYRAHVPQDSIIAGNAISPLLVGASSKRDFNQDVNLYSAFIQTTWNITEATRAIIGGRYTQETKTANRHGYHLTPSGAVLPEGSIYDPYNQLWGMFKIEPHSVSGHRAENNFTPKLSLLHDFNDNDQLYISYTTGNKSGGFDALSNSVPAKEGGIFSNIEGSWIFNEEKISSYEAGGKFLFAQNTAVLNISLYRAELRNIQSNQFDNGIGYNVNNTGQAVIQGLELDGHWDINSSLLIRARAATLDFEYTNLPNSPCYFGQIDNTEPIGDAACDASGNTRELAPKVQTDWGMDYTISLSNNLTLTNTFDIIHSSSYLTTNTLDPKMMQTGFTKINARIALRSPNNNWELALIGKNLTDKKIITYASDLPLASTLTQGQGSGYYAFYSQPRSIAIQASIKF